MAYNSQYSQYSQVQGAGRPRQDYQGPGGRRQDSMGTQRPAQVGATFTPGGVDDFYMPEVISPAPQRVMPEVPGNIQDNLAHLELEANPARQSTVVTSPVEAPNRSEAINFSTLRPPRHSSLQPLNPASQPPQANNGNGYGADYARHGSANGSTSSFQDYNQSGPEPVQSHQDYRDTIQTIRAGAIHLEPSFSPFPKLINPSANVPPSDDEKEAMLEQAREPVLNSNDPEMQLAWAQDALAYVEVAIQNEIRISENQPARAQTPQVEHQLRMDAMSVVAFLADQHHPKAEFMKGMWLEFGKFGYRVDKKEAFRAYTRAAEKGYARAEYRVGMQYEASNDPAKAIKHYNQGVALGDSASNYRLGMMTLLGQHGEKQDFAKGVQLIRFAAQHADENAPQGAYVYGMLQAHELDNIHIPELFLPLDINGARANIEKAAYLGFAKAQQKMGSAYELCQLGCDFNPALSLHYNALAARQGEAEADLAISKWFLCGYEGVFEKNEELAFIYAQRAAQGGLATAEFAMGYFYEVGIYIPSDLKKARRWYEVAAEHGNKDAAGRIESITQSKTLSKSDHEDVAITRIKSQYGSQRGKRPERFRAPKTPMPTISDDRVDMPDPSTSRLSVAQQPPRPASAAPYPLDDDLSQHGRRPSTGTGFINPNIRPSSAFGLNPNIQASQPPNPPLGGTGYGPPVGGYQSGPYQPRISTGSGFENYGPPGGRGGLGGRGGRGAYQPAPLNYRTPPGPGGAGPPPGSMPPNGRGQDGPAKAQAPRLDIGYSAPPDPGPDKRNRLQKAQSPSRNGTRPKRPSAGSESMLSPPLGPSKTPTTPDAGPSPDGYGPLVPPPRRTGTPGARSSSRPSSRTNSPARHAPEAVKPTTPRPLASQTPSQPSGGADAPAPQARPPGKGPKTFEEMGVPVVRQENDCLVM